MINQVSRDQLDPVVRSHHGFELRPSALELLLALDLLAFGGFLELGIDLGPFRCLQLQLSEPTFVVDGDRGAIDDRPLDVVDADVVAEDGASINLLDKTIAN